MILTSNRRVADPTSVYADLALDALKMAIWQHKTRQGADLSGLVHHSDQGIQYRASPLRPSPRRLQGRRLSRLHR